ncbi:WD40 repeat protein, partial [Coemansia sp. IMI 209127]
PLGDFPRLDMYWRINCTEHLLLDVRTDPTKEADSNSAEQQTRKKDNGRLGRQRSVTYSSGVGADVGRRLGAPHMLSKGAADSTLVIRWAGSPDGRLLVGITRQGVYLWTLKPFMQLSSLVYESVDEFGSPVDIVWKDEKEAHYDLRSSAGDSKVVATLFVVLAKGYVFELAVYKRDAAVLEYEFPTQHYFVRGPGEGKGVPALGLAQKRTYRLPGTGAAVCAAAQSTGDGAALVATRVHIHRLSWTGALVSSVAIKDIYDNPLAHISQILCISCTDAEIGIYLFSDGVIRMHKTRQNSSTGSDLKTVLDASTLDAADSTHKYTVMAYTPASRMVAIGTTTGDVLLYSVGAHTPDVASVGRIRFSHDRAAQVSSITWTADGLAMACGYTTGHVCVYSALGYELNTTRLSAQPPADVHQAPVPVSLLWVRGSTRLCVFSECVLAIDGTLARQQADMLPFARAALTTVACEGNTKRVCLFSDDKVFLNFCEFDKSSRNLTGQQQQQQPELLWHVAHIPAEYLAMNWPIRYVAADDDGKSVAVAGAHGVAWYSVEMRRWRMLRSQQQEESITCVGGLLWYRDYLVVACINHACGDSPQLVFFARSRPLDTTSEMHTVALEQPAVCISCHNSILLVLCRNGVLYQYAIFDDMDFIQVGFRRQIGFASVPEIDPMRVRSLQWVPSALFDSQPAFLVHQGTTLLVVEEQQQQQPDSAPLRASVVSDRAELTITSGVNFGNMHSTVWWFGGSQLHACLISLEDFMDGGTRPLLNNGAEQRRRREAICVRPEFFPIAVSADKGMAVGVDQDWVLDDHAVAGLSRLPVRAKLYLHNILDHMLSAANESDQDALLYAACFEHLEFFAHAMEILLHEVLVREMDRATTASKSTTTTNNEDVVILPRVIALLENFPSFYEIVVHCARKTEAAFWPHLFACVGGPERFFRHCLASGRLETATQCLLVLQTLEPSSVNEANILALLSRAVAAKNRPVCLEIMRFLGMAADSDADMKLVLEKLKRKQVVQV